MTILITTDYSAPGDEADHLLTAAGFEIRYALDVHDLNGDLDGVVGAILAHDRITDAVLERAPDLRAIVRSGVGYDAIDVDACTRRGVRVSNLPGINANAVAEYTMGLLLTGARRLDASAAGVRAGGWPRESGRELRGTVLGLVGWGATARAVAPLAQAFGMEVLRSTRVPGAAGVQLDELLERSDHVSLHTALTPRTRHLIDAAALRRMKPSAILVNTARGGLVDEDALVAAVRQGTIAGALLDVAGTEPLPPDSPLRGVDGITVYPHLAGQTEQARQAAATGAARELLASLRGSPRHPVNP